jgi:hypothetical protein
MAAVDTDRHIGTFVAALGILAVLCSAVSPVDDSFQSELIRPGPPSVTVVRHIKDLTQGLPLPRWICALAVMLQLLLPEIGLPSIPDEQLHLRTADAASPLVVHSPPPAGR